MPVHVIVYAWIVANKWGNARVLLGTIIFKTLGKPCETSHSNQAIGKHK